MEHYLITVGKLNRTGLPPLRSDRKPAFPSKLGRSLEMVSWLKETPAFTLTGQYLRCNQTHPDFAHQIPAYLHCCGKTTGLQYIR